ncbi:hypothetical protein [Maricaulis parjimensis]|uniref:hypothetical protein n=1 Tax=Maricaulis parjimensis TaxID=144023 RepID=UPI001939D483|nr:hypothetical protein [Maricaulis parjimensis]
MPQADKPVRKLSEDLVSLTLGPAMTWLDKVAAVEELSETNLAGRPLNYLIQLTGPISFCGGPNHENLAEFFLQFIPARTAIALLRPAGQAPSDCEAEFHVRLSAAGYVIGNFRHEDRALAWLEAHPTHCSELGLQCGPDCPEAYTSACPAVASREPQISPRLDVGPDAAPANHRQAGRP